MTAAPQADANGEQADTAGAAAQQALSETGRKKRKDTGARRAGQQLVVRAARTLRSGMKQLFEVAEEQESNVKPSWHPVRVYVR